MAWTPFSTSEHLFVGSGVSQGWGTSEKDEQSQSLARRTVWPQ